MDPARPASVNLDSKLLEFLNNLATYPAIAKPQLSEKLLDIPEYDEEESKLDNWEQKLIQKMDVNHDRFPTDRHKIAYAGNCLALGRKAHNLMSHNCKDSLSVLTSFANWRAQLRLAYDNPFEQENARKYLWETLTQGSKSFKEYYLLFA